MRKHSVPFVKPKADALQRWLARIGDDNHTTWRASFKMPSVEHAKCAIVDLGDVQGIELARREGAIVRVAFSGGAAALLVIGLLLGHGGHYMGTLRLVE